MDRKEVFGREEVEMTKVFCSKKCGFEDEYEPTEFGLDFYEAIGTCPNCEAPMVDEDGNETAVTIEFKLTEAT